MARQRYSALGERGVAGWFCEAVLTEDGERLTGDLYSRHRPGGTVIREKSFSVKLRASGLFVVDIGTSGNTIRFRAPLPHPEERKAIASKVVVEKKTYRVSARDYKTALGVFHNPGLFDPSEFKTAEQIIENHDQGATFSTRPRRYRPRSQRHRGFK